jgi:hypothetical protein
LRKNVEINGTGQNLSSKGEREKSGPSSIIIKTFASSFAITNPSFENVVIERRERREEKREREGSGSQTKVWFLLTEGSGEERK